jgi:hypothetical protein
MAAAVEFNDDPMLEAGKINDKVADRHLPPEVKPGWAKSA